MSLNNTNPKLTPHCLLLPSLMLLLYSCSSRPRHKKAFKKSDSQTSKTWLLSAHQTTFCNANMLYGTDALEFTEERYVRSNKLSKSIVSIVTIINVFETKSLNGFIEVSFIGICEVCGALVLHRTETDFLSVFTYRNCHIGISLFRQSKFQLFHFCHHF